MMMELWLLLTVVGLTFGAPVEQAKDASVLVKRAQEFIQFGNQQNAPKMKRGDPSMPVLSDENGSVRALPPQDLSETEPVPEPIPDENLETALGGETPTVSLDDKVAESDVERLENPQTETEVENELETEEEEDVPLDQGGNDIDEESVEEHSEPSEETVETPQGSLEESEDVEAPVDSSSEEKSDEDYDDYLWRWLEILPANRESPDYPENYYDGYYPYQPLMRNMQEDLLKSRPAQKTEVKRSHRTKRDLLFPDDETSPYYISPVDMSETLYDEPPFPYGESPEALSELNDPYYDLLETENPAYGEDMKGEEYENIKPIVYEGQPGYFVPVKRSDFLSFVPGNKRDQYFYPFSEEPQTHWGAFIPSKRQYTDSYANLVRLARKLEHPWRMDRYRDYDWE